MPNQNRKEYRKKFSSFGQIYAGGEILDITSYDVSVNGIRVEVEAGQFLHSIDDFDELIRQSGHVEIFVDELKLAGAAQIIWTQNKEDKVELGLEYINVNQEHSKLWITRHAYRKQTALSCIMQLADTSVQVTVINLSLDGLAIEGDLMNSRLEAGAVVKLKIEDSQTAWVVGRVIWRVNGKNDKVKMGLRYIALNPGLTSIGRTRIN